MSSSVSNPYTFNIQSNISITAPINAIQWPLSITFTGSQFQTPNHEVAYGFIGGSYTCVDNTGGSVNDFFNAFYLIPTYDGATVSSIKVVMNIGFIPTNALDPNDKTFCVTDAKSSRKVAVLNKDSLTQEGNTYTFSASSNDTSSPYVNVINWMLLSDLINDIKYGTGTTINLKVDTEVPSTETILYKADDYTYSYVNCTIPAGVTVVKVYCMAEIIESDAGLSSEASVRSYVGDKFNKLWAIAGISGNGTDEATRYVGVTPGKVYLLRISCGPGNIGNAEVRIFYSRVINAHAVDIEDY